MHLITSFRDQAISLFFLRAGLVFVLLYAAITGLLHPEKYVKWVPPQIIDALSLHLPFFLNVFFGVEIVLALLLISKRWAYLGALVAAILLTGITLLNVDALDIVFRNVGLVCAALALYFFERQKSFFEQNPPDFS